ncbi:helix-turn-helix domain-containing protein [bacterium]|jgi:transcriptional regulator GlxA family with amidase domain|uniref:Transcriptional regulator containing an amidase domain and an arac-type DNA-binding hth domain-protein n=1 Tax=uncultured alpha proteobacterium EB080_L43F08 TaxID=710797 RepID=E0Y190_9PROT|nr:transcriptional regulator containing an amidase domain and an arac-type DNA-binding hth domain-protein [uncultured alpha proteobacterium EB080_L43F08]EAU52205.1 transcriptional regulator, AraC family protein [alpha proteobacterium HTCC2255] [Rhodobacterales bacterium HTCC2255]MBT4133999.1 helix-turn-helix domain-containing protein [Rhodobacterales bacterium]MCO4796597.1 helix-turn-helix domain-containing protein [Amylibacter sp.]MDC1400146.1 helix-turn-helix domain-containing protein [bacter|tara:strand:+ start:6690 stop:7646 length:957 start_codon:yes stop_codon:yes gene_type:complete
MSIDLKQNNMKVDIILSDGFVMTELSGVVDVLRLANRVVDKKMFTFRYVSPEAGVVKSSADTWLNASALSNSPDADIAVFLGNSDLNFTSREIEKAVHKYRYTNAKVVLLAEAAAIYISANSDDGFGHTTHWENRLLLEERSGLYDIAPSLAVSTDKIVTCAGLVSTYDIMLQIVAGYLSKAKLLTISSILLLDKVRSFETRQPGAMDALSAGKDSHIDQAIKMMQSNIEEPLKTTELAKVLGQTTRSLERQFLRHLGRSPGRFYRELRLIRAQNFLVNTDMSILEIAAACGFGSNFGKIYKAYYGKTPRETRKERLV